MPASVVVIVLLAAMLHAAWNTLVKGGSDRYLDTAAILLGAGGISILILVVLPSPARASWPFLCGSALVHVVYFKLIAAAYQRGEMSLVYPISRGTAPALAAVCSVMVLHEYPTPIGWAGTALISAGVVTLAFDRASGRPLLAAPILLALLNAFVIAVYTLIDGAGVRLSRQPLSYTCWGFLLCALCFVPIAAAVRRGAVARHLQSHWTRGVIGGGCSLAAYALALWAMTRAPIASVAALRETSILFGVLIAACTLKEKVSRMRVIACLLIVCGAIVIKLA